MPVPGSHRFGVIMAGGAGERFWPLSRKDRPKQLLHLTDPDRSMLAEAVDRLALGIPREQIYVITSAALVPVIRKAQAGIPDANVVGEPCKRNTAGALLYIAAKILADHPSLNPGEVSVAIVTADHKIGEVERFSATVAAALKMAEESGALVICGIQPDSPETGFGYIQAGEPIASGAHEFLAVRAFHEKPNRERAEDFLANGGYFWNSGMFFWRLDAFYAEFTQARPAMALAGEAMLAALRAGDEAAATTAFESLEDISIDYALMEHARKVCMVKADFPWRDVGLWAHLDHLHAPDASGNSCVGEPVLINSEDCVVYNAPGARRMAVGLAGVRGLVVVVTEDAVLVVPKDQAQDVRHIVAELKKRDAPQV
ncbi:MAG: hypothetical protein RLZZ303_280 [Candidatus Hydrogenedentota bacterium]